MPRQLKPRTRAGGTWTEARYWQFIRSALRKATMFYPVKQQVKKAYRKSVTGQRHKFEYPCAHCGDWFMEKEISLDHITPAGSLKSYGDLAGFVERLFCEPKDLQILCHPCHTIKTNEEKKK